MATKITWQTLYADNKGNLKSGNPDLIYPGEVLTMPDGSSYTIVKGDTLSGIAARWNSDHETTVEEDQDAQLAEWAKTPAYEKLEDSKKETDGESQSTPPKPKPKPETTANFAAPPDWRFRVSLAPNADYFYKSSDPGILAPLKHTNGVVFPYSPNISVSYTANYETTQVTHSNYKLFNYNSSSIDTITVTGDFTAQDSAEANYMLAVIHFFRSATKMFYGKSSHRGVPPPMLYLSGFGQYQFDNHPVVLQSFTYTLPNDVDYINAYPNGSKGSGVNGAQINNFNLEGSNKNGPIRNWIEGQIARIANNGLAKIAGTAKDSKPGSTSGELTRVPTKISISLNFIPMISRYAMSNQFSLDDYASGKLLRGSQNPKTGGGVW